MRITEKYLNEVCDDINEMFKTRNVSVEYYVCSRNGYTAINPQIPLIVR